MPVKKRSNDTLKDICEEQDQAISDGPSRTVEINLRESDERGVKSTPLQKDLPITQSKRAEPSIWAPSDDTFLDLHVMLNDDIKCGEAYDLVKEALKTFSEDFQNFKEFPEAKKIVGYHFADTRPGCYRVELFEKEERLGINCTRLMGDAMAVTSLWDLLKRELVTKEFVTDDSVMFDGMTDDDDEGFFSDDDEDDDDLLMDSFKYLDFSRDAPFVNRLINEIEDKNVGTHSLMLLAFNLQNENNLDFLSENYGQEIFNKIVLRLQDSEHVDLPVSRCAASIIEQLIQKQVFNITVQQMKVILQTVLQWSQESGRAVTPSASEETSCRLTNVLGDLTSALTEDFDMQSELQQIHDETDFTSVKDNLGGFLIATN